MMEEKYSNLIKKIKEFLDGISEDYVCKYLTKDDIRYFYSRFIPELNEDENDRIKNAIGYTISQSTHKDGTLIDGITGQEALEWLKKQIPPKWLYRLEYKDETCGLWYNGEGKWCFEQGIGSLNGCKTKDLPMDHDERYKQDERDWFSSCSNKEDLLHWYSLKDAEELIKKGFVFTRYLATEYHEYENETVFIKDSSLVREEIDIFELFGKINPMFKEGDWLQYRSHEPFLVEEITEQGYVSGEECLPFEWENEIHFWTIQDAKDGDVLYINNTMSESIMIYKSFNNGVINKYASYNKFGFEGENYLTLNDGYIIPATKEQRNQLERAMTNAGYEWDEEKKELKKIEQKSAWSEEDTRLQRKLIELIYSVSYCDERENLSNWLKSLKERYTWKPSDEQLKSL